MKRLIMFQKYDNIVLKLKRLILALFDPMYSILYIANSLTTCNLERVYGFPHNGAYLTAFIFEASRKPTSPAWTAL